MKLRLHLSRLRLLKWGYYYAAIVLKNNIASINAQI